MKSKVTVCSNVYNLMVACLLASVAPYMVEVGGAEVTLSEGSGVRVQGSGSQSLGRGLVLGRGSFGN